jgi:hypothetical protein
MSANGAAQDTQALTRAATEARAREPAAPLVPQYATGFEGAACAPFPPEAAAILGGPVNPDEVEIRTDGIVYLPGVAYRRILTRAFGAGAWSLLPRGPARRVDDLMTYHGALYILGRFVSEAVGECTTRAGMTYASSLEGARTDCLTRCCKDLGIATELWDPTWRASWTAKYAYKNDQGKWYLRDKATNGNLAQGRNVGAPAMTPAQKFNDDGAKQAAALAPDTGEAPDETVISGIRKAVKALGWKAGYARIWLNGAFGQTSVEALTAQQAADALQLLEACQVDDGDETYQAVRAKLAAEGRVKAAP